MNTANVLFKKRSFIEVMFCKKKLNYKAIQKDSALSPVLFLGKEYRNQRYV